MTEETKNRDDTINRPDGSTYLEEKSVLRNGATPDEANEYLRTIAENCRKGGCVGVRKRRW